MNPRPSPHGATVFLALALAFAAPLRAADSVPNTGSLDTPYYRFTVRGDEAAAEVLDKRTQVVWRSAGHTNRLGWLVRSGGDPARPLPLGQCEVRVARDTLTADFRPFPDQPRAKLRLTARALPDRQTLDLSFAADPEVNLESLCLLEGLLSVTDAGKGYVLLPVREGLLIPADSGKNYTRTFNTYAYEGCHMAMLGAVQNGAAAVLTWEDPYVSAELKSEVDAPRQRIAPSLVLRKSAKSFQLRFLGAGDYVAIAKAYRQVAKERGRLVTWDQKLRSHPERAKLFGAANIKLWSTLDRRMNETSTAEESVRVNWTFEEAAQTAEHYKRDLKLDNVLFMIGGWIHRGYDNQHPDILPAAPECGGDTAFADCARRVMDLGYIFCLHDNYQDIYKDSPSWDERLIMKTPDGKIVRGGHWAGGLAYLTCSQTALELARRPQNLPAVKKLSNANAYFIDTTYAAGLQECFDPAHPLTRQDDMKWKQALSDYAREVFGIFGSECGREWAVPHSDFFEGLTGVSGRFYHDAELPGQLGATVVPLFDLVYRDCIAMYGKYGYDPHQAAEYVLHHITLGRPLNYHSIPSHLYWKQNAERELQLGLRPVGAEVMHASGRQFAISYRWDVQKPVSGDWTIFVHFTDRSGNIKFQNDHLPQPALSQWQTGQTVQGPFTITVPEGLSGSFGVRLGLYQPSTGARAILVGRDNGERSYLVGRLRVDTDKIEYQPETSRPQTSPGDPALFTRADNGWGADLHPMDRFIKNTCEVLNPLNELTARRQMARHDFLTADRKVARTRFGEGRDAVDVLINISGADWSCSSKLGGDILLPPHGFLIESPTFVAFHARNWSGKNYDSPPLFTLRSLDFKPLARSQRVRIYHGFGDETIHLGGRKHLVPREATIDPAKAPKRPLTGR